MTTTEHFWPHVQMLVTMSHFSTVGPSAYSEVSSWENNK